jgi:hypothetical protein
VWGALRPALATTLLAALLGGCRAEGRSPGAPEASVDTAVSPAARTGGGVAAETNAAPDGAPSDDTAEFVPRAPVQPWATWPMPNSRLPGLPNPQNYDTRIPGVVLDQVTGLMWQRSAASTLQTFVGAQKECERLSLGGYDDWRLPSRIELVSILDGTRTQPSIDVGAFPGTPSHWFWTSSPAADDPNSAWYVYFYFGYPKIEEKRNRFAVRCVRTATPHPPVPKRYEIQAETVRDVATGLTWQRAVPSGKYKFDAAHAYCDKLALGGKKGWRVPTLTELLTLVDERAAAPMIDRAAFPGTPSEQFWTSTNFSGGRLEGWYVYFSHGDALYDLVTSLYRVRCVL